MRDPKPGIEGNNWWNDMYFAQQGAAPSTRWYRQASVTSAVYYAVDDVVWQMVRGMRLKGATTSDKLDVLHNWLNIWKGTFYETRATIQVQNYIGALLRGGQLRHPTHEHQLGNPKVRYVEGNYYVITRER